MPRHRQLHGIANGPIPSNKPCSHSCFTSCLLPEKRASTHGSWAAHSSVLEPNPARVTEPSVAPCIQRGVNAADTDLQPELASTFRITLAPDPLRGIDSCQPVLAAVVFRPGALFWSLKAFAFLNLTARRVSSRVTRKKPHLLLHQRLVLANGHIVDFVQFLLGVGRLRSPRVPSAGCRLRASKAQETAL